MPVRSRNDKRHATLEPDEVMWLVGELDPKGDMQFMHVDHLEAVWNLHGDKNRFHWDRTMSIPAAI